MEVTGQFSGYIALALTVYGLSLVDDRMLRKVNLTACLLWTLHYMLLYQVSATMMLVLASIMIYASISDRPRILESAVVINIALVPLTAALVMTGHAEWMEISPVIAGLFINVGISRFSGSRMTYMLIVGHVFWIPPAIDMGSVPVFISATFNMISLGYREIKMRRLSGAVPGYHQDSKPLSTSF